MLVTNPTYPYKARSWIGEWPDLPCLVKEQLERRIEVAHVPAAHKAMVAVEVLIPHGGKFSYAILAGEFVPSDSNELVVQVASSQTGETITDWSLAGGLDAVKSGIPAWATEDILNAALEAAKTQSIAPGCLRFPSGAHGVIGSNAWVFRGLAKVVVALVSADDRSPTAEELSSLLRRHLS